ncbi:MAG: TMEM43 family protein [Nitrospinota bacterium]|nr:TMEM43 family protein [Nitrospinota bacterium]
MLAKAVWFIFHMAMVAVMITMPWWVGRTYATYAKRISALAEGEDLLAASSASPCSQASDGKIVYLTAPMKPESPAQDPLTAVAAKAIALERKVEMLQWKREMPGMKYFTGSSYAKVWSEEAIDDAGYPEKYRNPGPMPYKSATIPAERVTVGCMDISTEMAQKVYHPAPLGLSDSMADEASRRLGRPARRVDGYLYIGHSPAREPAIGDIRISYQYAPARLQVSAIAMQGPGPILVPFTASNGEKIAIINSGQITADQLWDIHGAIYTMAALGQTLAAALLMIIALRALLSLLPGYDGPMARRVGLWRAAALLDGAIILGALALVELGNSPVIGGLMAGAGLYLLANLWRLTRRGRDGEGKEIV